ncbi:hypothetical protein HKI87_10g62600 [Chloropicon roscoffensis]|uniref:Ribosomal protein L2 n=1 Tax=Chloropicon roscoffensis TaxID=1461544 RepID=A0AAX4PEU2_9CHLO
MILSERSKTFPGGKLRGRTRWRGRSLNSEFLPPAAAGGLGFRRFLRALRGARRGGRRANVEARWVGLTEAAHATALV